MVDKTDLFNGSNFADIFCYTNTVSDNWYYVGILLLVFIFILGYGYKRNYESQLIFFVASFITFILSTIFLLSSNNVGCNLISEQNYIVSVLLVIGSIINYIYNKPENV